MTRVLVSTLLVAQLAIAPVSIAQTRTPGKRSKAHLVLAAANFPLEERPTFEDDLEYLADVVAAKIYSPPHDYARDIDARCEAARLLRLVSDWPNPKFYAPLTRLYHRTEDHVIECAEAMVSQDDQAMRAVVETRLGYKRIDDAGCFGTIERSVAEILNSRRAGERSFPVLTTLLPVPDNEKCGDKLSWTVEPTIPGAVAQFRSDHPSIRFQSWLWLAERGIVGTTEVVLENWQRLKECQQMAIADIEPRFVGRKRLLALYEDLALQSSPALKKRLLIQRAKLGSDLALAEAHHAIDEALKDDDFAVKLLDGHGRTALEAICETPSVSDIPLFIQLHRCADEELADLAIRALCEIDHPDAISEVGSALVNHENCLLGFHLAAQARKQLVDRNSYLAILSAALRKEDADTFFLVHTFECMSGQDFGWKDLRLRFDAENEWRASADACLKWYDETIAAGQVRHE